MESLPVVVLLCESNFFYITLLFIIDATVAAVRAALYVQRRCLSLSLLGFDVACSSVCICFFSQLQVSCSLQPGLRSVHNLQSPK